METRKMKNGNGYGNHANVKGLRVNVKLIDGKWRLNCKIIIYKQILVEKLLLDIDRDKDRQIETNKKTLTSLRIFWCISK